MVHLERCSESETAIFGFSNLAKLDRAWHNFLNSDFLGHNYAHFYPTIRIDSKQRSGLDKCIELD